MANRSLNGAPGTNLFFQPFQDIWENSEVYPHTHRTRNLFQALSFSDRHPKCHEFWRLCHFKTNFLDIFFFVGNLENINYWDWKMV